MPIRARGASTRQILLSAGRQLLGSGRAISLEEVARAAGVSRLTVYYHFGSRRGLLEALLGDPDLAPPADGLAESVEASCAAWASDRDVLRALRAHGVLDRDLGQVIGEREERRRDRWRALASELLDEGRLEDGLSLASAADALVVLTGFEVYDALAGRRSPRAVAALILRLAGGIVRPAAPGVPTQA